jgi:hypothetical protein
MPPATGRVPAPPLETPLTPGEAATPPATPSEEQPEVLTRGPVHEAFAEPVTVAVEAGVVAPTEPPANIQEVPPADRPQGGNYVWVPGYWAWDSERNGYIWVSACWRFAPPKMYWVPGYWAQVRGGWEWVAGFWAPVADQQIEYLPAPPELEDIQPPGLPPTPDHIWVPPCWYWYGGQYVPRPGYWMVAQPDWVWVPSHYVWTPRGYVFVEGHWDYPLEGRGVLFAPIYFPRYVYAHVGFVYSPSIILDVGALQVSLFAFPRYHHYYFGDYYDDVYVREGIYPWSDSVRVHIWYDPIYVHERWSHHRTDPRWEEHNRRDYDMRRDDRNLRPPRTYRKMEDRVSTVPEPQRKNFRVAQPLSAAVNDKATQTRFEHINNDARQKIAKQADDLRKFGDDRHRWETPKGGPKTGQTPADRKEPVTPPTNRKGPATPPSDRDRKEPVAPPTDRKGPATPPGDRDRKEPVTPPTDRKGPATPPSDRDRKEPMTPPTDRKREPMPPRDVQPTQPDRVNVPNPPGRGKLSDSDTGERKPPARPTDEYKHKDEGRDKDRRTD